MNKFSVLFLGILSIFALCFPMDVQAEPVKSTSPYKFVDFSVPSTAANLVIDADAIATGSHIYQFTLNYLDTSTDSSAVVTIGFHYDGVTETTKALFGLGAVYSRTWECYADTITITAIADSTDFTYEVKNGN